MTMAYDHYTEMVHQQQQRLAEDAQRHAHRAAAPGTVFGGMPVSLLVVVALLALALVLSLA